MIYYGLKFKTAILLFYINVCMRAHTHIYKLYVSMYLFGKLIV